MYIFPAPKAELETTGHSSIARVRFLDYMAMVLLNK